MYLSLSCSIYTAHNFVEEKKRSQIPTDLMRWPLNPLEHVNDTACIVTSPAGPAGCRNFYFLHLISLRISSVYSNLVEPKFCM